MAKQTVKKSSKKNTGLWPQPGGDFVSAIVLLGMAYLLASLAIDSGSLLQWSGTIVALVWGIARLVQGAKSLITR